MTVAVPLAALVGLLVGWCWWLGRPPPTADPADETERNDRVWGEGNWTHCPICAGVHHSDYHRRGIHDQGPPTIEEGNR